MLTYSQGAPTVTQANTNTNTHTHSRTVTLKRKRVPRSVLLRVSEPGQLAPPPVCSLPRPLVHPPLVRWRGGGFYFGQRIYLVSVTFASLSFSRDKEKNWARNSNNMRSLEPAHTVVECALCPSRGGGGGGGAKNSSCFRYSSPCPL